MKEKGDGIKRAGRKGRKTEKEKARRKRRRAEEKKKSEEREGMNTCSRHARLTNM